MIKMKKGQFYSTKKCVILLKKNGVHFIVCDMSAHVLLNSLNKLGKRDKMPGLLSILSLFCDEFNKFNTT